ncbi:polyketide synthase PksD [Amniculicola lignicola CBS 123094]|uniref:Polyketide synthase PksD n=1 Tax=Amniculicola lignicola CBS 123094 TaxID=1392246 RepID=A0A6A5WAD8_9PLEO|nr:polyketide synthase PksD [Amniculicola lignicola CBS 123094]
MEQIAIIGMSFKLPQEAVDEAGLWDVLSTGRNVMTEWPQSRGNINAFYTTNMSKNNMMYSEGAHFLKEDAAVFDAPFFSITAKEAASMDPQQRWLLETTYRALENAGIPVEEASGSRTAVFTASMADDYCRILSKDPDTSPRTTITGIAPSILSNRLSWYFDLRGPSVHIDTACSSSMVAMDLACQNLRNGQSDMAVVAGCNLILSPEAPLLLSNMNFLSPDSQCYSFDHRANGYARGEGVIVVVLKRLADAIRDNDTIRAVIRGTASNQDGHTPGITQPSIIAQESLIKQLYQECGLKLQDTRYVEAHGTGTSIGDPIEAEAIGRVFRSSRSPAEPLYIGSVKANIGHLEGGSGLAGIVKAVLMLEKGIIPPQAAFEKLNPRIKAKFYNLAIATKRTPWPTRGLRRISVNSFGFGGSNSHIILDDAYHTLHALNVRANHRTEIASGCSFLTNGLNTVIGEPLHMSDLQQNGTGQDDTLQINTLQNDIPMNGALLKGAIPKGTVQSGSLPDDAIQSNINESSKETDTTQTTKLEAHQVPERTQPYTIQSALSRRLLIWSARDEAALQRMLHSYIEHYQTLQQNPNDINRLALTLSNRRSVMLWRSFAVVDTDTASITPILPVAKAGRSSAHPVIAFIFTGQGAQYANMGLDLLQYPKFKKTIAQAEKIFQELGADWNVWEVLQDEEKISKPEFSQPLCTAIQIALVDLLKSFAILPAAVVGHSSGEIGAAYAAGALSIHSACKIAYHRGRLAGKLVRSAEIPSAMLSVNLSEQEAGGILKKSRGVHIACVNSPTNVTLSGTESTIDSLREDFETSAIFAQKLKTGIAYHTPMMESIAQEHVLMISSVTGASVASATLRQPSYWVRNLVSPVRFLDALQYLGGIAPKRELGQSVTDLLEVGPHGALRRPVADTLPTLRYSSLLSRFEDNLKTTMEAAGRLWTFGFPVSVDAVNHLDYVKETPAAFSTHTPEYPFDHTLTYWHESRFSSDFRLRASAPEPVLGARAYDWNPLEPKWRKILSLEDDPWIGDHVIGDTALYPAAGTLMMALEAVKQHARAYPATNHPISGFLVKEAEFVSPIIVRAGLEGQAEVLISLRPLQSPYEKWSECFRATIHTEYEEDATPVDNGREVTEAAMSCVRAWKLAEDTCHHTIKKEELYEYFESHGAHYGDSFSLLGPVLWDRADVAIAHVPVDSHSAQAYPGLVHPAVFDAVFQLCVTAPSNGLINYLHTMVPHKIFDAWVSPAQWRPPVATSVRMLTTSKVKTGAAGLHCSITALADDNTPLCYIRRVEMAPMLSTNASVEVQEKKLLYNVEWKPQLSMLEPAQLAALCQADCFTEDENSMIEYCNELETTLLAVVANTMGTLQKADLERTPQHMKKYVAWMERQTQLSHKTATIECLEKQIERVENMRPSWRLFMAIARNLVPIVLGDVDPLEVMFSSGLAEEFYADVFNNICDFKFSTLLGLASHEKPAQRILEVGAGTGGMTSHVLAMFQEIEKQTGSHAFAEYVYTDVSAGFFEKAKAKFSAFADRMTFKPLDLERSIAEQGFDAQGYDLVIAGSVLHATADLDATLKNVRRALKPGGKIIFLEITAPDRLATNFGFGVLPGWWLSKEQYRTWSPGVTEEKWDEVLRANGFSGNDLVLRDYKSEDSRFFSIVVSTAVEETPEVAVDSRIIFAVADGNEDQKNIASLVTSALSQRSYKAVCTTVAGLKDLTATKNGLLIFLADFNQRFLSSLDESTFHDLQSMVQKWENLLWITSTNINDSSFPFAGMKNGLLRSLRSESNARRFISLSLEDNRMLEMERLVSHIVRVFEAAFHRRSPELEYVVQDGIIRTGRMVEEIALNTQLRSGIVPVPVQETWSPGPPLKFVVGNPGSLESLRFVEDPETAKDLGPDEVEIEAKAWGLAFRDVFIALGRLEEDDFGSDCAGIVRRVGSACTTVKPGDRVCMAAMGCLRMYPRSHEWTVVKIPNSLSFEEATSIIGPGTTAYYSLIEIARLQKGEKILIHAAAGGTGQVALMVAQMMGAEVFATVGYDEKKQLLVSQFGIPPDHIFYSRNSSFAKGIMRFTQGYGVDVVLNCLAGDSLRASWECIAPYGRFIEIGKADIKANSALPMSCFAKNVSFSAVDLHHIGCNRFDIARRLLNSTMDLVAGGRIHCPKPLHVYPVSQIEDAFRYLQSGKNTGRIVITSAPEDIVTKCILKYPDWRFDVNGSYIVAGGLGGIGRAILSWMVGKGAKNIIVLSRSGPTSSTAVNIVGDLISQGINIYAPKCDASCINSLSDVLEECARTMPPVRGCINGAMVLQDSVFENMSYSQWDLATRTKVRSSWNLHKLLPRGLDFFVQLASLAGIYGTVGQSNYAAGCSFQDALARYRSSHCQKALSIDLGWMYSIGIVAETEAYQKNRAVQADMGQIENSEFFSLLDMVCDPNRLIPSPEKSQILVGALTPADLIAQGQEPAEVLMRPLFSGFSKVRGITQSPGALNSINDAALFRRAKSGEERTEVVITALSHKLARALSISVEDIDTDKHLPAFGVDSLVAVELRNWIGKEFEADVAVFDLMGGTTVKAIGKLVAKKTAISIEG